VSTVDILRVARYYASRQGSHGRQEEPTILHPALWWRMVPSADAWEGARNGSGAMWPWRRAPIDGWDRLPGCMRLRRGPWRRCGTVAEWWNEPTRLGDNPLANPEPKTGMHTPTTISAPAATITQQPW